MSNKYLIGISGKAGAGKTTLAHAAAFLFNDSKSGSAVVMSLADPLREMVGIPKDHPKYRESTQATGKIIRTMNQLFFINDLFRRILDLPPEVEIIIIDDVRYLNEAEGIKEVSGTVVRLEGGGLEGDAGKHPSETELDNYEFDLVCVNPKKYQPQLTAYLMINSLL